MHRLAALAVVLVGCSAPATPDFGHGSFSGSPRPATPDGGPRADAGTIALGDAAAPPPVECGDAAKLPYVIDELATLYRFDPSVPAFSKVATIDCGEPYAFPGSMAVDRTGTAWVNYTDGRVFKVSTTDGRCEPTPYEPNQHGVMMFGMGFSTDGATATSESLFVCDLGGGGIGRIDTGSLALTMLSGSGTSASRGCELTGTGDGRLFGFFAGGTTSPENGQASIAEVDKATAALRAEAPLAGVDTATDWAFSFYGSDFYLYTANRNVAGSSSDVWRYRPADASVTKVMTAIGFRVTGAGVSTCAPVTPVLK